MKYLNYHFENKYIISNIKSEIKQSYINVRTSVETSYSIIFSCDLQRKLHTLVVVSENNCESIVSQEGAKNETQCRYVNERKRGRRRKAHQLSTIDQTHYPSEFKNHRVQLRHTKRGHNDASFKENTGQFARMKNWSLLYYNR